MSIIVITLRYLEDATWKQPEDTYTLVFLGVIRALEGDLDEAMRDLDQAAAVKAIAGK